MPDRPKGGTVARELRQREPVRNPKPYDESRKHMSKAEAVEANRKAREKATKLAEYAAQIDKEQEGKAVEASAPKKTKKKE